MNEMYKVLANNNRKPHIFKTGDLFSLHLSKQRFPNMRKNKLMPRLENPFKIIQKVNDNTFKLELPRDCGVTVTFNIGDLAYYLHDDVAQLRTIAFEENEYDLSMDD